MIQGGDPTGTGRGGTSIYGQKLYAIGHRLYPSPPNWHYNTAKTKYLPNYDLQAPEYSQWQIRDPTRTVHLCHSLSLGSYIYPTRFPILYNVRTDAISGQQAHNIPPLTRPNIVCLLSRYGVGPNVIKNWEPSGIDIEIRTERKRVA